MCTIPCADTMSNLGLNVFVCFLTHAHTQTLAYIHRERVSETVLEIPRFSQNK